MFVCLVVPQYIYDSKSQKILKADPAQAFITSNVLKMAGVWTTITAAPKNHQACGTWVRIEVEDRAKAGLYLLRTAIYSDLIRQSMMPSIFKSLVNGVDPFTKEPLVGNAMSPDRIAFHDFTCSAPKSVSVVWSQANDELAAKILKAQEKSADAFLDHISDHAYYRYGKGSVNNAQSPIRAVKFEHGSARSIDGNMVRADPQIHTHCVVMNLLESQHNDKPAYALETKSIMGQQGVAASLYHAQLAWEMRELGFEIEKDGNLLKSQAFLEQ